MTRTRKEREAENQTYIFATLMYESIRDEMRQA